MLTRSSTPYLRRSDAATGSTRSLGGFRSSGTPTLAGPTDGHSTSHPRAVRSAHREQAQAGLRPAEAGEDHTAPCPLLVRRHRRPDTRVGPIGIPAAESDLQHRHPRRPHPQESLPREGRGNRQGHRPTIPNVDQVAALTQSMPEQYRAAVTLAAWGTLRRGEVLGLNREAVDLRSGTVLVVRSGAPPSPAVALWRLDVSDWRQDQAETGRTARAGLSARARATTANRNKVMLGSTLDGWWSVGTRIS
jgi:hypothetical protein